MGIDYLLPIFTDAIGNDDAEICGKRSSIRATSRSRTTPSTRTFTNESAISKPPATKTASIIISVRLLELLTQMVHKTGDLRIKEIKELLPPDILLRDFPITETAAQPPSRGGARYTVFCMGPMTVCWSSLVRAPSTTPRRRSNMQKVEERKGTARRRSPDCRCGFISRSRAPQLDGRA